MNRALVITGFAIGWWACSGYVPVPTDEGDRTAPERDDPDTALVDPGDFPVADEDALAEDIFDEGIAGDPMSADDGSDQVLGDPGSDDPALPDPGEEVGPMSGKIRVVPALIDFGAWPAGVSVEVPFSVQNVGSGALMLTKFWLQGDPAFTLLVGYDPKVLGDKVEYDIPDTLLKAGSSFDGKVRFTAIQAKEAHAEMRVFSSDPDYPDGYVVHILANKKVPCLKFTPSSLDFGAHVVGDHVVLESRMDACGELPLVISNIEVSPQAQSSGFSLGFEKFPLGQAPTKTAPLTLQPGERVTLAVHYAPTKPSPKDETGLPIPESFEVVVSDNTFTGASFLPIRGFAVSEACAMPVIRVAEGTKVPVGTLLHLSGKSSYSPFGPITAWKWSVSQPPGNHGSLLPSESASDVTFLVGVTGEYSFQLEVNDAKGSGSCSAAKVTVFGEAKNLATFLLSWRPVQPFTPKPPFLGPDLDLHFLHPKAAGVDADQDGKPDGYYDLPWDCFWYNPTPNWDNPQPTTWYDDDARLLYDNTDGSGPEVIVMGLQCDALNNYRIGVHFFDDHGYGPVDATIQAYVSGNLVWEGQTRLTSLDLWDAAVFHCGSQKVTAIPGPVIKHNYKNPSFVVPQ